MVRDGIITPATRAGNQMGFALPDILRVEAGQLPKLRGLKSLTPDQRAAVPGLLELLGLEREELTPAGIESLLNVYHSMRYDRRLDGLEVGVHLELLARSVRAVSRSETVATIAASDTLTDQVRELARLVGGLMPIKKGGERKE